MNKFMRHSLNTLGAMSMFVSLIFMFVKSEHAYSLFQMAKSNDGMIFGVAIIIGVILTASSVSTLFLSFKSIHFISSTAQSLLEFSLFIYLFASIVSNDISYPGHIAAILIFIAFAGIFHLIAAMIKDDKEDQ